MRLWLGAVLVGGLLLGLGSPAQALVIDSFSAGAFNLTDTGAGTTSTQACGSFCLGGSREVFLRGAGLASPATAQLGVGEATSVLPLGSLLSFTYRLPPGTSVDLTVGGTATAVEVSVTAFAPGADLSVTLTDTSGASQTVTVTPSFPTPPTPAAPGIVVFPLSSFPAVDAGITVDQAFTIDVNDVNEVGGDYHVTLFEAPGSGPSTATPLLLTGVTMISGPPFPSPVLPIRAFHPPNPITPLLDIEFSIMDATNAAGQISATASASESRHGDIVITMFDDQLDAATLQYRFDFLPPPPGVIAPDDQVPDLNWTPGNNWFEIKVEVVDVGIEAGTVNLTLFGETGLNQPINLTNVTAVMGSTLLTVEVTGPVNGTIPALNMTLGGEFTPTTLVPVFAPHDLAPLLLAGLVMGGALVLVTRVRRRGAARL